MGKIGISYPLNGKSFCQKTLSRKGGYPPSLTESPLNFSGKFFPKGLKMMFFALNKVKNGPPINGQNPLKRFWKVPLVAQHSIA